MRVVITGGTGLIGRALSASLARDGHEVVATSRRPGGDQGLPDGVRTVGWDGRSAEGWGEWVDGAGAVVNLAGESIAGESVPSILFSRWTPEKRSRIINSRVHAGRAVVDAITAASRQPAVLIQPSGANYYGVGLPGIAQEDTPPGSDFLATTCVVWEESTAPVEAMGVRRAILRTAVVLSAEGGVLPLMLLPFRFFLGGPVGSGRQALPWVHMADVVGTIRFAIENPHAEGAFNLVAPQGINNAEFSRAIGRVMRRPSFIPVPGFVLRLMMGEKAMLVLEGRQLAPRRLLDLGYAFRFAEAEAALHDILG